MTGLYPDLSSASDWLKSGGYIGFNVKSPFNLTASLTARIKTNSGMMTRAIALWQLLYYNYGSCILLIETSIFVNTDLSVTEYICNPHQSHER